MSFKCYLLHLVTDRDKLEKRGCFFSYKPYKHRNIIISPHGAFAHKFEFVFRKNIIYITIANISGNKNEISYIDEDNVFVNGNKKKFSLEYRKYVKYRPRLPPSLRP